MTPKDLIELILGVAGLAGVIYQLAQVERHIYDEIDKLKDSIIARLCVNETKFDVHMQDYANRKESIDYKLGGLNEKIEHRYNRLREEIKLWMLKEK